MPFYASPIYIVPGAPAVLAIKVYSDAGLTVLIDTIIKKNITEVAPVYNPVPGSEYPYNTLTQVSIRLTDGEDFTFECQNVANQAGWDNGTQANLTQAVNDIIASL